MALSIRLVLFCCLIWCHTYNTCPASLCVVVRPASAGQQIQLTSTHQQLSIDDVSVQEHRHAPCRSSGVEPSDPRIKKGPDNASRLPTTSGSANRQGHPDPRELKEEPHKRSTA